MKVYLLDINPEMIEAWKAYFCDEEKVQVVHAAFDTFMREEQVDCVISPANSFGIMDGGYDAAITEWFGESLQQRVQDYIIKHYYGEQPVGSSFIIDTPQAGVRLIHTPSMRLPERIRDDAVVYHCMRTCLMTALNNGVQRIVIPAFGGATGGVNRKSIAKMMWFAYRQVTHPPKKVSWEYADETHFRPRF